MENPMVYYVFTLASHTYYGPFPDRETATFWAKECSYEACQVITTPPDQWSLVLKP